MSLEKEVPYESITGNQYLIGFSLFNLDGYDFDFNIPVINITLQLVSEHFSQLTYKDLQQITKIISDYISENDVVLYYMCDNADLKRSVKNSTKKPQEYRSILFGKMFERTTNYNLIKDDINIYGTNPETIYYTSIISHSKNKSALTKISNEISAFNDK